MKEYIFYHTGVSAGKGIHLMLFTSSPLSITFFLTANTSVLYNEIYDSLSLPKRLHISYYLSKSNGIYPINKLRNIAIDHVNTTHFWVADMDMWPSRILMLDCC